jgi:D-arabinose 1-dehydrogenase-like Zn-dependent alcohol dehydrogenase
MKARRIVNVDESLQIQELQTPKPKGSMSIQDMIELASSAKRRVIKPVVSYGFKLDQFGEVLQMLKDGKIVGRGVINQ